MCLMMMMMMMMMMMGGKESSTNGRKDGRTDGLDEGNIRFSQFCDSA
jgi:hypothetical protein